MKKLNITKEAFEKSNYFKNKYGKLEYVSESGKVFKTDKGRILMFKESSERMSYEDLLKKFEEIQNKIGEDAALDTEVYWTYDPLDEDEQEYIEKKGYTPFITWYSLQSAYGNNICWPSGAYEGSKHCKLRPAATVWELCRFFKKNLKKFSGYKVIGALSGYDKIKDIKQENGRVIVVIGKSNENDNVNESTKRFSKKFAKEGTESNPRFKCMEDVGVTTSTGGHYTTFLIDMVAGFLEKQRGIDDVEYGDDGILVTFSDGGKVAVSFEQTV